MVKDQKDKIVYIKGDEELADLSNQVDFSQGFKNRKIAEALCGDNPHEERILQSYVELLKGQKKRREHYLRVKQRNFFVTQVFEKNLNPYVDGTKPKPPSVSLRADSGCQESKNKFDQVYAQTQKDSTDLEDSKGLNRSHTFAVSKSHGQQNLPGIGILQDTKDLQSQRSVGTSQSTKAKHTWDHHYPRLYLKSPGSRKTRSPPSKPSSPPKEVLDQIQIPAVSKRQNIDTFRKNPHLIFPKLKGLITTPCVDDVTGSTKPTSPAKCEIKLRKTESRSGATLPVVTIKESDHEEKKTVKPNIGQAGEMMKMITEISTDLPEHLKVTARKQIRKMTKSDQIYHYKSILKSENRPYLEREHSFGDKRWMKLEKSLAPILGDGTKWRQLYKAGPWVVEKNNTFV